MADPDDRRWMERAVALGRRGWGRVHPNPMVGCVLVRDGVLVGEGWHREWGGPHAEVEALAAAGAAAEGTVAFVSLEPCRHRGKTPPCTRALLDAGVRRVVFGAPDPGIRSGGGAKELQGAGVEVVGPVLTPEEARRENPAFFHHLPDRPWTVLKLALSLDGRISPAQGQRARLTGPEAMEAVHHLRAGVDGILVGTETAAVDDPLLTVRGALVPRVPPVRIVLDLKGRLGPGLRLLQAEGPPVWILTGAGSPPEWRKRMEGAGARILEVDRGGVGEGPSPRDLLRRLRGEGIGSLLCEGGGRWGSALAGAGAVDRLVHIVAPLFLGPQGVPGYPTGTGGVEGAEGTAPLGPRDLPPTGGVGRTGTPPTGDLWAPGPVRRLGRDLWMEWDRTWERDWEGTGGGKWDGRWDGRVDRNLPRESGIPPQRVLEDE
jgi:diaminohydroxyphosphoribosylaminopyrimidine deaminase / 5-amino-6-(5-phosphoribosylamino)uracil reductase